MHNHSIVIKRFLLIKLCLSNNARWPVNLNPADECTYILYIDFFFLLEIKGGKRERKTKQAEETKWIQTSVRHQSDGS